MHTCAKDIITSEGVHFVVLCFILIIVIIIIIALIKYLVRFMPIKLPIHVGKQNDIDHLTPQSPLLIVKKNLNFKICLHKYFLRSKPFLWSKGFCVRIKDFWAYDDDPTNILSLQTIRRNFHQFLVFCLLWHDLFPSPLFHSS